MSTRAPLGDATRVWLLWKRTHEKIRGEIVSRTIVPGDISDPELGVLVTLYQSGAAVRQSELARQLRWDRTRLSHLLTRMSGRGYIERVKSSTGVDVALLPAGAAIIENAAPDLEVAAQQLIVDRLGSEDANTLRLLLERLDRAEP